MGVFQNLILHYKRKKNRGKIEVRKECPICRRTLSVFLTPEEFKNLQKYRAGEGYIQEMLPNISPANREFLAKTGYCGKCWKKVMK